MTGMPFPANTKVQRSLRNDPAKTTSVACPSLHATKQTASSIGYRHAAHGHLPKALLYYYYSYAAVVLILAVYELMKRLTCECQ